jgi:hypothetical protein
MVLVTSQYNIQDEYKAQAIQQAENLVSQVLQAANNNQNLAPFYLPLQNVQNKLQEIRLWTPNPRTYAQGDDFATGFVTKSQ